MASRKEIEEKINYALSNLNTLSYIELKEIYSEVAKYIEGLPEKERGNFYWENAIECLTMIIEGGAK